MKSSTLVDKARTAQVMLIDDNRGDVMLTQRAFMDAKIAVQITVAETGEDAIAMLNKKEGYEHVPTPDIILLDLNLPKMHGLDVLNAIKSDALLKQIPVMILSSSCAEQDVSKSYTFHANGYMVKPVNLEKFKNFVEKLEQFWFELIVQPDFNDIKRV